MDLSGDRLAGVVDLFGALTRDELETAVDELAFRRGADVATDERAEAIDDAVETYALVSVDGLLVPGPAAFPELPDDAADLPHIMDVDERDVDHEALQTAVQERFRADAATAVSDGDDADVDVLVDLSYDIEAATGTDLSDARDLMLDER